MPIVSTIPGKAKCNGVNSPPENSIANGSGSVANSASHPVDDSILA